MTQPPNIPPITHAVQRPKLRRPPFWMVATLLVLVVVTWLPLVLIARARTQYQSVPRVHIIQDMDNQPKYKPQDVARIFADDRAMRPPIPGTVARGELQLDDHYYRGFTQVYDPSTGKYDFTFFEDFPPQVQVDLTLLQRGQERYAIYCAPCHGYDGYGEGPIAKRSSELGNPLNPTNLHEQFVRDRAVGYIYNVINNGIRNMPPYGAQVQVPDRWAIVAYVRALQLSQHAPARVVPAETMQTLR